MKKLYIQPCTKAVAVKLNHILCCSITEKDNTLKATLDNEVGDFGKDDVINSRDSYWEW